MSATPSRSIVVQGKLESWNTGWNQNRWSRQETNQKWRWAVLAAVNTTPLQNAMLTGVDLRVTRFGARAIDVDNIMAKPLIDGLKASGVLVNDDPRAVRSLTLVSETCKKGKEHVVVVIS